MVSGDPFAQGRSTARARRPPQNSARLASPFSGVGGTMGNIWASSGTTPETVQPQSQSIRDGRPDLAGPSRNSTSPSDGTVTIVAVGPCNHAGRAHGTVCHR